VIVEVDSTLIEEARRFRLVYACESCASFDPDTGACSLGYPNEEHRADPPLAVGGRLVFCKEFEAF
jgi:hypothetical protein